jgi:hypothetical protein
MLMPSTPFASPQVLLSRLFRVVSRTQIPATTQVSAISVAGSIPAAPQEKMEENMQVRV